MSAMNYIALALLAALACSVVGILWALDLSDDRRSQGAYRATWRQRRGWAAERRRAGWRT